MKTLILLIVLSTLTYTQNQSDRAISPIDTSFTTYSSYQKEKVNYPFIEIAKAEISTNVLFKKDIVYKTISSRELHLDLFYPAEITAKIPAVILIHGGGWRSGNKTMDHPLAVKIAEAGYVTAAIEYRLSPEAKYPAAIHDLQDAVQWLKENAELYKIDPDRIAALGTSAGGTLACLLGTASSGAPFNNRNEYDEITSKINAIVDIDGIVDFTHPAESGKDTISDKPSAGKLWLGSSFKDNPDLWIEASPLTYAGKETPPILFINSSNDRFHAGRDQFIEKVKPFNIPYEVKTIPDTPHPFWLFYPWFNQTVDYTLSFLDKIFKDKK